MPIRIIEDEETHRWHLILEVKRRGVSHFFGVADAPTFVSKKEATSAKKNVTIMSAAGITAAMYIDA